MGSRRIQGARNKRRRLRDMKRKRKVNNGKELTFTCNVEIYDKQKNLANTGLLTYSLGYS